MNSVFALRVDPVNNSCRVKSAFCRGSSARRAFVAGTERLFIRSF
nr:hypothetical protein [Klebsiella michiganensis]